MAIIPILLTLAYYILETFFVIQLTIATINFIGKHQGGFFETSNPLAWIVTFVLLAIIVSVARPIFRLINRIIGRGLAGIITGLFARGPGGAFAIQATIAALLGIGWLIGSGIITARTMDYFAAHPGLNGWLAQGNWLAYTLVYCAILATVYSTPKSNSKNSEEESAELRA